MHRVAVPQAEGLQLVSQGQRPWNVVRQQYNSKLQLVSHAFENDHLVRFDLWHDDLAIRAVHAEPQGFAARRKVDVRTLTSHRLPISQRTALIF